MSTAGGGGVEENPYSFRHYLPRQRTSEDDDPAPSRPRRGSRPSQPPAQPAGRRPESPLRRDSREEFPATFDIFSDGWMLSNPRSATSPNLHERLSTASNTNNNATQDNLAEFLRSNSLSNVTVDEGPSKLDYALENSLLRKEASRLESRLLESDETRGRLQRQLERAFQQIQVLQQREAEDTHTMERVIQQVEENLEATTSRAQAAEATVVRLSEESTRLQVSLERSEEELRRLKEDGCLCGDRSLQKQAADSAYLLRTTAGSAEEMMAEMGAGLQRLKMVALTLESLGKVKEMPGEES